MMHFRNNWDPCYKCIFLGPTFYTRNPEAQNHLRILCVATQSCDSGVTSLSPQFLVLIRGGVRRMHTPQYGLRTQ